MNTLLMTEDDDVYKIFVSFKDQAESFDKIQLLSNGKDTGYLQDEGQREGFAYHLMLPKSYKMKRFSHSPAECVDYLSDTVCGT